MNKLFLTGNLTRDPEGHTTPNGVFVATLTVAVRLRYHAQGEPDAQFVRVKAWRRLGESCMKYLAKGKKVGVVGEVTAHAYQSNDGGIRGSLEVSADEVEFLSPSRESQGGGGYTQASNDDLPDEWQKETR